jgi:hypothetical protein
MKTYKLQFLSTKGLGREIPYWLYVECENDADAKTVGHRLADSLDSQLLGYLEQIE